VPTLKYQDRLYECRAGETVLDAMMRQGAEMPFSCRNGTCQVCLQRCVRGTVPAGAQKGLRPHLRALGYFLPCRCRPEGDIEFTLPRPEDLYTQAVVRDKTLLSPNVMRLLLEPVTNLRYRAGQFINLRRADGLIRSYSLASLPDEDDCLELHVKRMRGGLLSNWIFDTLNVDDMLDIQGPEGYVCYTATDPSEPLLLIGGGTGLAPLIGIVRDALKREHTGGIHLFHGVRDPSELYLRDALLALSSQHPNFCYTACVAHDQVPAGTLRGHPHDVAFALHPQAKSWRLYIAGPEHMVRAADDLALRAGVRPDRIHADPFTYKELRAQPRPAAAAVTPESAGTTAKHKPMPDPEMWAALREGELLTTILTEFYTRVFEDSQLAPYFRGVTKQRLIEKVYSFMRSLFTGEKIFFGDNPRNAHHWMVISDELFDYREAMMTAVLRRHGLPEHLVRRWNGIEETFRGDIVKSSPRVKIMAGVEMPLDGYGEMAVTVGTLCDGCANEIHPGERVRYHLRLGSTYCRNCATPFSAGGADGRQS
jgi:ferredoxin-NADP reductase